MDDLLNSAIQALKEESLRTEGFSDGTRARIVEAAWREALQMPVRRVFDPLRWLTVAGVIPVVVVVVMSLIPPQVRRGPEFVGATKIGEEVMFTIRDGLGRHSVVRSTDAAQFNEAGAKRVVDGRFLDRTNSGPVVVFYRID